MVSTGEKIVWEHGSTSRSRCWTVVNAPWKRWQCSATARLERDRRIQRTGEDRERLVHGTGWWRFRHCSTGSWDDNDNAGHRSRANALRRQRWQSFTGKRLTSRLTLLRLLCHERSVWFTEKTHAATRRRGASPTTVSTRSRRFPVWTDAGQAREERSLTAPIATSRAQPSAAGAVSEAGHWVCCS